MPEILPEDAEEGARQSTFRAGYRTGFGDGFDAADAGIVSAEQARGNAMISLTAEVARTYLSLRGAQRQRAIVLADIEDQRALFKLADSRSRNGFAAQADAMHPSRRSAMEPRITRPGSSESPPASTTPTTPPPPGPCWPSLRCRPSRRESAARRSPAAW